MSIRNLTLRLLEEAAEAQRRKSVASSVSAPPAGAVARQTQAEAPQQGTTVVSGRSGAKEGLSLNAPASAVPLGPEPLRRLGLRSRTEDTQWRVPGGIAARFRIQSQAAPAQEPQPSSEATGDANRSPVPDGDPADHEDAQAKREEVTPITIELQSH